MRWCWRPTVMSAFCKAMPFPVPQGTVILDLTAATMPQTLSYAAYSQQFRPSSFLSS